MKHYKQIVSGFLSLSITSSICTYGLPVALAANSNIDFPASINLNKVTGDIAVSINFALPQTKEEVESRNVKIKLTGNGISKEVTLDGKDKDGVTLQYREAQKELASCDVIFSGLEIGTYIIEVTGDGYTTVSHEVKLSDYSKQIIIGTDDGTFSLGDFDGNGLTSADRDIFNEHLGSKDADAIKKYDLNGDNEIDIVDLSYINHNISLHGEPFVRSTNIIAGLSIDESVVVSEGQNASKIFEKNNNEPVQFKFQNGSELSIPITLSSNDGKAVEVSKINITSPYSNGSIENGKATVEYIDDDGIAKTKVVDLTQENPDVSTFANSYKNFGTSTNNTLLRASNENVLTINLGKKVAVKKVTITVTKVVGDTDYAAISKVEFLEDITSNLPKDDTTKPKTISAFAGDGFVNLSWSSVSNVTGYKVYYGTDKNAMTDSISTKSNKAKVEGLKNSTTYYFNVVATNGDWSGTPSNTVTATPLVSAPPKGAPSNINVEAADSAIRVNWGSVEDATFYQLFYRKKGENSFNQFGGNISSTASTITGLENGTEYEIALKAGNQAGLSGYSSVVLCTPKKEDISLPDLPTDGRIDASNITSITMANPSNVDTSLCPNFNTSHFIDNDASTYWIAKMYNLDSSITFTFNEPQDMNYAIFVPYLNDRYKNRIDTYSIIAKNENGEIVSKANGHVKLTSNNYVITKFPYAKDIKSLTISLGEKVGGPRVSISDIAFYKSSTLVDDISALFVDDTFTSLKPDVNIDRINQLENELNATSDYYIDLNRLRDEINLAKSLLNSDTSAIGLVKENFVSRSISNDNNNYGQSASDLQPIGVTAKAGSVVAVYAQVPQGENVYVIPTQYYGESGIWRGEPIKLESGRNYITVPRIGNLSDERGGQLYLAYEGDNAEQIKIHVRGDNTTMFRTPVLELSNWYELDEKSRKKVISEYITNLQTYISSTLSNDNNLKTSVKNATEISTPSVLLSIPASKVLNGLMSASSIDVKETFENLSNAKNIDVDTMTDVMYNNIIAWEEELFVANKVQGIIPSETEFNESYRYPMQTRQNIRYMRMFAGAFMYAAGNHIGVEYDSCSPLVKGKPTKLTSGQPQNGLFGWGIAHEIGHNMDKIGYAETTNNIYSLAMQAWDGGDMTSHTTRLTADNRWKKIFDKVAQGRAGAANDVFVQLGMYWQLHLAYDDAENPLDFYNKFFKKFKDANEYNGYTKDERIALIASDIANRDLSEFFTRWGMTLGENALDTIRRHPKEDRAIWYMNDESRTSRIKGVGVNSGQTNVTASASENTVTLNITNTDSSTILGYEIIRNGVKIGFTTSDTYVDNVGAANNLTYTYEVTPIDKCGNIGNTVKANEILISYDKVIDKGLYDVVNGEDGVVTITMKNNNVIPVTGLKITGASSGNVSVKVSSIYSTTEDANFIVAKEEAQLDSDTNIIYFNKPNVDNSDTRIWAYDTAIMKISGVPSGANIELLDYPGDKVDFYNGTAIGRLKNDYHYGDDVVKANTLVVIGTYRGDPAHNYIEVEAEYNTTAEAAEENGTTTIKRAINGYGLMFAEVPEDGAVSDISDGFFMFVPDLDAESSLNQAAGVTDNLPLEIRVNLYRTDSPDNMESKRLTSQTLWISFPDEDSIPYIDLKSDVK